MALDVSKLRQQEQVQATGNNPAASTSASSSSQPIDMKTGTMTPEEKQAKLLEFIKSGEFKKCPDDQKLELLKQQFPDLAGLSEKDLAKYLAEAINTLPAEEKSEVTKTLAKTIDENTLNTELKNASDSAAVKQTSDATPEKATTNDTNSQDLEALALQYAEKNKIGASIDEIISHIKAKQVENTQLTEEEQQILNLYSANNNTEAEASQSTQETSVDKKAQTKENELQTAVSEYAKNNKLENTNRDDIINLILEKELSGEPLTAEETKIAELYNEISSEQTEDSTITQAKQTTNQRHSRAHHHHDNRAHNHDNKLFTKEEIEELTNGDYSKSEQQDKIVDRFLEKNDPDYRALSDKEKKEYLEANKSILLSCFENYDLDDEDTKTTITSKMLRVLDYANQEELSISELQKLGPEAIISELDKKESEQLFNIIQASENNQSIPLEDRLNIIVTEFLQETNQFVGLSDKKKEELLAETELKLVEKLTGSELCDLNPRNKDDKKILDEYTIRATLILDQLSDELETKEDIATFLTEIRSGNIEISMQDDVNTELKLIDNEISRRKEQEGDVDPEILERKEKLEEYQALFEVYPDIKTNQDMLNALKEYSKDHELGPNLNKKLITLTRFEKFGDTTELNKNASTLTLYEKCNHSIKKPRRKGFLISSNGIKNGAEAAANAIRESIQRDRDFIELKKNGTEEEKLTFVTDLLTKAYGNQKADDTDWNEGTQAEIEAIRKVAKKLGIKKDEFEELLKSTRVQTSQLANASDNQFATILNNVKDSKLQEGATRAAYNKDCGLSPDTMGQVTEDALKSGNNGRISASIEGQTEYLTPEEIVNVNSKVNTEEIPSDVYADYGEALVVQTKGDENKVTVGKGLGSLGNAALTEGVAAGGQSITDQNLRNQYNSIITQAAQNYPPEVQQTIQTALTTGQISEQTRNNSAPASNSYYPEADTYTPPTTFGNTNSNTNNSNTYSNTHNSNYSSQTTTQTYSNQGTTSNPSFNPTEVYTSNVYPQNTYSNSFVTPDIETSIRGYNPTTPSVETSNYTVSSTSTAKVDHQQVRENAAAKQAEANQQMKDLALENAAEVKQQIEESIAEWELKQELKLSDEVVSELKEIAASEALEEFIQTNPTKKQEIIQKLSSATSLSEVYDILLSNLGSKVHQKFIENLASAGSTSEVRAFLKSKAGNTAVIKEILLRTSNQTLRSELINMLPACDVIELLENNLISTLNSVDHKIIYEYLAKNIYSMTQTNFANYLKYLPFDEREKLIAMRNQAYGIKSEQDKKADVKVETTTQGAQQDQQTVAQNQPTQPKVATNPQNPQPHTPATKKPEATINPQTQLRSNETRRVLNDGRIATSQDTTYAGLSNKAEEGIKIIDPNAEKKAKEGAHIGMNGEVLVPGSQAWLTQYNKQAPAFTMAALEEQAEDTGLNLGSNHAKNGQLIKKEKPNGFNLRG